MRRRWAAPTVAFPLAVITALLVVVGLLSFALYLAFPVPETLGWPMTATFAIGVVTFAAAGAVIVGARPGNLIGSLRSFGARGWLELTQDGWRFRPTTFVPGMGGIAAMIRLFVGGRRRARRYLATRGIEPPEIRWDRLNALKRQVKAERAARSLAR